MKNNLKNIIVDFANDKELQKRYVNKFVGFLAQLLKYTFMFGLCFIILYPILQQIMVAVRDPNDINDPMVKWVPNTLSIQNFIIAAWGLNYKTALINTATLSFICTILQVAITALVGYAFTRLKFPGSKLLFGLVVLTIIIPPATIAIPQFLQVVELGLYGKLSALYVITALGMGLKSGIFIYLFRQFFRGIPVDLEDAALVDGAGPFKVFYKVMLPNARGAIITVALFAFVWQWNDSYYASLFVKLDQYPLLTTKLQTIMYGLQSVLSNLDKNYWALIGDDITKNPLFTSMILNTAGIMIMAPLIIGYCFFQRLFVEGIERTGIVG
jgi:multiple sugar transport system permease protein